MTRIPKISNWLDAALVTGTLLLTCAVGLVQAQDTGNRFENQLKPVAPAPAGEWWKESWSEGWAYEHSGDFSLSARVRIKNKSEVSWWQALLGSKVEQYLGELNLEVRGNSKAESGVLRKGSGEILLTRYYPETDVRRAIFRKAIEDTTVVDKLLNWVVDNKKRRNDIKNFFRAMCVDAGSLISTYFGDPNSGIVAGVFVGDFVADIVGTKADDLTSSQLKKHGIQSRPDGGVEISPDSSLLQGLEATKAAAEIANLAVQLNDKFNRRIFLIRASEKPGEELDTRQIFDDKEKDDVRVFFEKKESDGSNKAVEWLKSRMPNYRQPEEVVRGVFQRESFALSSQIFNALERKPGDVWVVSGEFFNSFLHPDLQGRFRGNVVLRYIRDAKVPSRYDNTELFEAREVEILYKGTVDGREQHSTLEYVEPDFSAKLREDVEGVLFIDKTHGYLRQADLILDSDARSSLPGMKILKGFEAVGNARFEVHYTCTGTPPEKAR